MWVSWNTPGFKFRAEATRGHCGAAPAGMPSANVDSATTIQGVPVVGFIFSVSRSRRAVSSSIDPRSTASGMVLAHSVR